jgi:hypothetical protein
LPPSFEITKSYYNSFPRRKFKHECR